MVLDDFKANGKKSLVVIQRRIEKHLQPYFGGRRLAGITTADVLAYIAHRQAEGIVATKGKRTGTRVRDVSNAEINRELQALKRMFSLAIACGRLAMKPKITLLKEAPARSGFFSREQVESVITHLPDALRPVVRFAFITGWRMHSEVLKLEWRNVDMQAGELRLDAGTTKSGDGGVFPLTAELRTLLEARDRERQQLRKAGHVCALVFHRMVAKGRGGPKAPKPITAFGKAWKHACRAAGCPGRIPHDLRRSAVRTFVRAGIGEDTAMELSGHKTPSVFRRYNIVSGDDLRDAARKLDASAPAVIHKTA